MNWLALGCIDRVHHLTMFTVLGEMRSGWIFSSKGSTVSRTHTNTYSTNTHAQLMCVQYSVFASVCTGVCARHGTRMSERANENIQLLRPSVFDGGLLLLGLPLTAFRLRRWMLLDVALFHARALSRWCLLQLEGSSRRTEWWTGTYQRKIPSSFPTGYPVALTDSHPTSRF